MDKKKYAKIFKALSNPNRLEMFMTIAKCKEQNFENAIIDLDVDDECFIYDVFRLTSTIGAPTISHHLKELENAGLIITEKRGKNLVAKVNRTMLNSLSELFNMK